MNTCFIGAGEGREGGREGKRRTYPQTLELLLGRIAHLNAPANLLQPPHDVIQDVLQIHFHVMPNLLVVHQVADHGCHGPDATLQPLQLALHS